jgi:hypothetical protein
MRSMRASPRPAAGSFIISRIFWAASAAGASPATAHRVTLFARIGALIARPGNESAYDIYADASYTEYIRSWLAAAFRLTAEDA